MLFYQDVDVRVTAVHQIIDGEQLPLNTKVVGMTVASVFGRYYKALTRTNPVTYRLESLYPSGTEREEETYSQVKHHVDKSFCPSNLEESMLSGINKRAGMVATSRLLRQSRIAPWWLHSPRPLLRLLTDLQEAHFWVSASACVGERGLYE